jgi:hypothetical protein
MSQLTFIEVFTSYSLFVVALTNQMFFLSSFFTDPKLASDLLGISNLIVSFFWLLAFGLDENICQPLGEFIRALHIPLNSD